MEKPDSIQSYRNNIEELCFGKRVGPFVYIHKNGVSKAGDAIRAIVSLASQLAEAACLPFNVIKLGVNRPSISLLHYPGFAQDAFPLLSVSGKFDESTLSLKITDFSERENRPLLHRKELLLPPGHDDYERFARVTRQAEELGLFRDRTAIGLSLQWAKKLAQAGVKVVGHSLVAQSKTVIEVIEKPLAPVQRHKSAMRRRALSLPLQAVETHGYLNGELSIFDYGCGRGDDIELLKQMSIDADGWDPYYRPNVRKQKADIVHLGYVINVIEDPDERRHALEESFSLARRFLIVSALIGNPEYSGRTREHGDGLITTIGTFQKYYLPDELENYIREVLRVPTIAISQGILLAFCSSAEADRFRARRAGMRRSRPLGTPARAAELFSLDESARHVLYSFWQSCVALGREPLESEASCAEDLHALGLSISTAFRFLTERLGTQDLDNSAAFRRRDMLVQFALGQFDGRVYFKHLSEDVRKDIVTFFGTFSELNEAAKALLFSISDTTKLLEAAYSATSDEIGYFLRDNAIQFHVDQLAELPAILRVYVGCAVRLIGGLGRANLIKVHIESGKVSFMAYDDFDNEAIPNLIERIKVNLWARRTEYFDYIAGFAPPPLLMKSLFMPRTSANFAAQETFDRALLKAGLFDASDPHPSNAEFSQRLECSGLRVDGFELVGSPAAGKMG